MIRDRRQVTLERVEKATDIPLTVLSLVTVGLLVIPAVTDLSRSVEIGFLVADIAIWAVFAVDLTIRTWLSENRTRYLRSHWWDVVIVLLPFLRPLRALRVLRLARGGTFFLRYSHGMRRLAGQSGFVPILVAGSLSVVVLATLVSFVESDGGGSIESPGDAAWWALSTVTTVGYGDTFPITTIGRVFGAGMMLVGIAVFGGLTAQVTAYLIAGREIGERTPPDEVIQRLEHIESLLRDLSDPNSAKAI